MRAKSTTAMGREHEEYVVSLYEWANGWRSRSSGANFAQPIDVTTDVSVIECEATENKSYRLTLDFWREVESKQHTGKIPTLAIRLRDATSDKHVDLGVIDLAELSALQEELEVYRDRAIDRDSQVRKRRLG